MKHFEFSKQFSHSEVAILIKPMQFKAIEIAQHYVNTLIHAKVSADNIAAWSLDYPQNKATVSTQKKHLDRLLPVLDKQGCKLILCADANYFKTLTKQRKADPHFGYVLDCDYKEYTHIKVCYVPNYAGFIYNDALKEKLTLSMCAAIDYLNGTYIPLGQSILQNAYYPTAKDNYVDIKHALNQLSTYDHLAVDIETYALKFYDAGIGSIAFATSATDGVAFKVDIDKETPNYVLRELLADFFENFKGKMIFHNANFDVKVLIYTLFMDNLLDEEGKQIGLSVFNNIDDTKLLSYLALNNTSRANLSLKELAHEYVGNYAVDVKDITKLDTEVLLEYNLLDSCATMYVYDKYLPIVHADNQYNVYQEIFLPSVYVLLQMELTGMPMDMDKVHELDDLLTNKIKDIYRAFNVLPFIPTFVDKLRQRARDEANAKLKTKVKPLSDFDHIVFNPNSNPQLQELLYDVLGLPVFDRTASGAPAAGGDTLAKLVNHTSDPDVLLLLNSLIEFSNADKIQNTFVKAFKNAIQKDDEHHYLFGNFNIGGTVSGRLSSSEPNLQNIPSGGNPYAKYVKECFSAPKGWIFVGADFASLEDRISALTTQDPNKLKVYTDGYDGHCLRAYSYFGDKMPDIDPNCVDSINSIESKYKALRQLSKAPTFLLTYGGTYHGLISNCGFTQEEAIDIETKYHDLYAVSDQWVEKQVAQASQTGYVECAFGLKLRTPLLKKAVMNHHKTPYEAKAEARTAGNALGQSYGLLNNRAAIEVQQKVLNSPFKHDIIPVAHIHDAQYFLIKDDIDAVEYLNEVLIDAMLWQDLDAIRHPDVGLGGNLSVFYPNWAHDITIANNASQAEIKHTVQGYLKDLDS